MVALPLASVTLMTRFRLSYSNAVTLPSASVIEIRLMEITHFERGSALISTNNNNIAVEIKCSQMEKDLITTDRRELAELAQRAATKQNPS